MQKTLSTPEELFDRQWRTGRAYRPIAGRRRQVFMLALLLVLAGLIGGYWYITDAARVRRMAESYLSELVGGRVEIRRANLSLFEGLRLDGVTVRVDEQQRSDSVVFSAQTLLVKYNAHALINGRLEASQIVALDPHVRLCEDLSRGERAWNYQRLGKRPAAPEGSAATGKPPALPEILLRSGQIDYARIVAGKYESLGSMAIEGQFAPGAEPSQYRFEMESRGMGESVGPSIRGVVNVEARRVEANLRSFNFRGAIKTMLPAQVQEWLEAHGLAGQIEVPNFVYQPMPSGKHQFEVDVLLRDVSLSLRREEFLTVSARRHYEQRSGMCQRLWAASFNPAGAADILAETCAFEPIRLSMVSGRITFKRDAAGDSIEIGQAQDELRGRLEDNSFKFFGRIDGFDASAGMQLSLTSPNIYIPPYPHYVNSLPPEVRAVYWRIRPQGTMQLELNLSRAPGDAPVRAAGKVTILDGGICHELFAYPLHKMTGVVEFGHDGRRGKDWLYIRNAKGHGLPDSANAGATFTINGLVTPLDDTNYVWLTVRGEKLVLDDGLFAALDPGTRDAMALFAGPGLKYPRISGDLEAWAQRPEGPDEEYAVSVDLHVKDGAGAYRDFPYPLEKLTGTLRIRPVQVDSSGKIAPPYLEVDGATVRRGGGELRIDGRVDLHRDGARASLALKAAGMPIDDALLAALGPAERDWIRKLGAQGRIDLEGRLQSPDRPASATTRPAELLLDYDLNLALRDGTAYPFDGTPTLAGITAQARLTPGRVSISNFSATRGEGALIGRATINRDAAGARLVLNAEARNIALDAGLYRALPESVRPAWDKLRPEGTVDVDFNYSSAAGDEPPGYEAVLRPRKLAITYADLPYRLEELGGAVVLTPNTVALQDLTGKHGPATVRVSGSQTNGGAWTLRLAADKLLIDDDLRKALPPSVAGVLDSLKIVGAVSIDCPRLIHRPVAAMPTTAGSRPAAPLTEFSTRLKLIDVAFQSGIAVKNASGDVALTGRAGGGQPTVIDGEVDLAGFELEGRPVKHFRCTLSKPADREAMQLSKIQTEICGGDLTGQVEVEWPNPGTPGRYALLTMLKDADVRELTGDPNFQGQGRVSASLGLQANWNDPASRRGGGDVLVTGKEMVRIPLLLGLMNVTNLTLPIASSYNQATARYDVDGQRALFRKIELQSGNMLMQGSGSIDYESRKVRMTFVTATAGGWKIPLLDPLIQPARQELLQIHVTGTVQEPKVAAGSMQSFTTTIDEVFKGPQTRPSGRPK